VERAKRVVRTLSVLFLVCACGRTAAQPNPFFAMDTAVRDLNALDTIKTLGYAGISWKTGPSADVVVSLAQVQHRGLKLFAVYSYQYAQLTRTQLILDPNLDSTMEALRGTDVVLWLPINSEAFPPGSPLGDSTAVPVLQGLADRAAQHGVRVAIYPHMNCWTERVQDAVRVAKKVNRKNFGVTFNLCHCLMAGDEAKIPELLTQAMPYLFVVTINGADSAAAQTSWKRLIRPLDDGSYDVDRVIEKLEELHYTGPVGLQGFGVEIPVKENLARSMSAWRRLTERR